MQAARSGTALSRLLASRQAGGMVAFGAWCKADRWTFYQHEPFDLVELVLLQRMARVAVITGR